MVPRVCVEFDAEAKEVPGASGDRVILTETFQTMTADLLVLRDWLQAYGGTHVALESTGVYWKPVYYVLEDAFTLLLINMQELKRAPGRKTDVKDSEWLAQLLECGLLRSSLVPPAPMRELRDLTRYRVEQVQRQPVPVGEDGMRSSTRCGGLDCVLLNRRMHRVTELFSVMTIHGSSFGMAGGSVGIVSGAGVAAREGAPRCGGGTCAVNAASSFRCIMRPFRENAAM